MLVLLDIERLADNTWIFGASSDGGSMAASTEKPRAKKAEARAEGAEAATEELEVDARVLGVIGSAAGAIMLAENVELLLATPDALVGQLVKSEVLRLRALLLVDRTPSARGDVLRTGPRGAGLALKVLGYGRMRKVSLELPPQEHFPEKDVSDADIREEAKRNRQNLVASGKLLTSAQLQAALSMSRQAVSLATREQRLFKVDVAGKGYYPAFFAREDINRRDLETISKALGALPGWTKWDFFTAPRETFGDINALDALAKGKSEIVRKIAGRFFEEAIS
jgi:hypothetical protein